MSLCKSFLLFTAVIHLALSTRDNYVDVKWGAYEKGSPLVISGVKVGYNGPVQRKLQLVPKEDTFKITYKGGKGRYEKEFKLQSSLGPNEGDTIRFKKTKVTSTKSTHDWTLNEFADLIIDGRVFVKMHDTDEYPDMFVLLKAATLTQGTMNDLDALDENSYTLDDIWEKSAIDEDQQETDALRQEFELFLHERVTAYFNAVFSFANAVDQVSDDVDESESVKQKALNRIYNNYISKNAKVTLVIDAKLRNMLKTQKKSKWKDIDPQTGACVYIVFLCVVGNVFKQMRHGNLYLHGQSKNCPAHGMTLNSHTILYDIWWKFH